MAGNTCPVLTVNLSPSKAPEQMLKDQRGVQGPLPSLVDGITATLHLIDCTFLCLSTNTFSSFSASSSHRCLIAAGTSPTLPPEQQLCFGVLLLLAIGDESRAFRSRRRRKNVRDIFHSRRAASHRVSLVTSHNKESCPELSSIKMRLLWPIKRQ